MAQDFSVYQHIAVPVLTLRATDHSGFKIIDANEAWTLTTDLSETACIGCALTDTFDERSAQMLEKLMLTVLRTGMPERSICNIDVPSGHSWFDVSLKLAPETIPGGGKTIIATFHDITDQQEIKNRLFQHYTHHLDIQQQMEQFVSFAAHDLRSPMRNVQMLAEMLRDDFVDHGDGKLEMIDMLEEIAVKASHLIDDMLNYARTTELSETQSVVNLEDICSDIGLVLDPYGTHSITCVPCHLKCDPVVMRILLQNLVDNSIKYSEGSAAIEVAQQPSGAGFIRLRIADHGLGFDDPSLVFLNQGTFRAESGFGLFGLKRLIEGRGGRIWAMPPNEGEGAVIFAEIPGEVLRAAA